MNRAYPVLNSTSLDLNVLSGVLDSTLDELRNTAWPTVMANVYGKYVYKFVSVLKVTSANGQND